jgi:hypothetical protein
MDLGFAFDFTGCDQAPLMGRQAQGAGYAGG